MTVPNFVAEGRIKELAAAEGVRIEALEDIITRYRAGQFNEAELPDMIAEWRVTRDHYFSSTTSAVDAEAVAAFGENRSLTAQGAFVRKHGEAVAAEIAAKFGTAIGSTKPGKTPEQFKPKDADVNADLPKGSTNPWARTAENCDANGRYTAKAITRQTDVVKRLGEVKAAGIAHAARSFIGATRAT